MDKACAQLGVERACRTADTPVPGVEQGHYWLGHRLHEVEEHHLQGDLVCECELVTRAMLEQAARTTRPSRSTTCAAMCGWAWGRARAASAPSAPWAFCTRWARGDGRGARKQPAAPRARRRGTWPTCSRPPTTSARKRRRRRSNRRFDNAEPAPARLPAGALARADADSVGAATQAGAAGRTDLPEHHERRPPAARRRHQPADGVLAVRHDAGRTAQTEGDDL